jgi:hypothetical protein
MPRSRHRHRKILVAAVCGSTCLALSSAVAANAGPRPAPASASHAPHASAAVAHGDSKHKTQHGYVFEKIKSVRVNHKNCHKISLNGVNNHGMIVGTTYCGHAAAFTLSKKGKEKVYQLPKSKSHNTYASNIANNGAIAVVGSHHKKSPIESFIKVPGSGDPWQKIKYPAPSHGTQVQGINSAGDAVGLYCQKKKCSPPVGFSEVDGGYTTFQPQSQKTLLPVLNDINDHGEVCGYGYDQSLTIHSFVDPLYGGGKSRNVNAPKAGHGKFEGTVITALANDGTYDGYALRSHNRTLGYVHRNGKWKSFNLGSDKHGGTEFNGAANGGEVVGQYYAKHHHPHDIAVVGVPKHGKDKLPHLSKK